MCIYSSQPTHMLSRFQSRCWSPGNCDRFGGVRSYQKDIYTFRYHISVTRPFHNLIINQIDNLISLSKTRIWCNKESCMSRVNAHMYTCVHLF